MILFESLQLHVIYIPVLSGVITLFRVTVCAVGGIAVLQKPYPLPLGLKGTLIYNRNRSPHVSCSQCSYQILQDLFFFLSEVCGLLE